MNLTDNTNDVFKVPKIKRKANLERLMLNSNQFKLDLLPKIVSNFERPAISEKMMVFTSAWLINNDEAEQRHIKRRHLMRKSMPHLSYSVGFIYVDDFKKIRQIAQTGRIENGNVKNSHLATPLLGVSLCQFADIYHQGDARIGVPNNGYLILVKYLKGKINYVPCDSSPMDPQPQFDCHIVKNPKISSQTTSSSAFHQTQVFIYEYTEDGFIAKCQTKILPFAVVQFKWIGKYLFKMSRQRVEKSLNCEDRAQDQITDHTISENERHISTFSILVKNATSIIPFKLSVKGCPNVQLKSNAYLYFINPINSFLKSDNVWTISGVITENEFEKELKKIQISCNSTKSANSMKDLLDPLSQDFIISLNRPNLLSSTDNDSESTQFDELSNLPQFVTYTRIVLESFKHSKRLIDLFTLSKTMGFINRSNEPDISILLFPDGKLSKRLGIPSVLGISYFHGLVFHAQHPQFITLNNTPETKTEKDLYFASLSAFKKQFIQSKFRSLPPLITFDVLKQSTKLQANLQRSFLLKIVKPQTNIAAYKSICFQMNCEDYDCDYHNPSKKARIDTLTNKGNVVNAHKQSFQSSNIALKKNERQCLSEKLFDYIKHGLTEISTDDLNKKHDTFDKTHEAIVIKDTAPQKKDVSCNLVPCIGEVMNSKACIYEGIINCDTKELFPIPNNEDDNGSFHSLKFVSFSKSLHEDSGGFRITDFKYPSTNGHYEVSKSVPEDMWSFNKQRFRQIKDWPGISSYD